MKQFYHVNKRCKKDPDIKIDDLIAVSNESQLSHLPKGRQKLAIKHVGPYKVTKVDRATSNYTLDIQDSKRHPTFHISNIKKYIDLHLELFSNHQRRQSRISSAKQDLNLEIEKIISHEWLRNDNIHFLCKWKGFPNENMTFRNIKDFKSSSYDIKVVKDYLLGFGDSLEELKTWMK